MAQTTQAFVGTIKTFFMQKGWGHIECEQTHQLYGKDIFLLRSQLNGIVPAQGDQVYFDVVEGQKGAEATNVNIVSQAQLNGHGAYIGTVKSWNPVKGWGHLECDTTHAIYEKDVFVMRSAIPGGECRIGDQVSFSVQEGQKGIEAAKVTILSTKAPRQGSQFMNYGQTHGFVGSVKSFDEEKGWGHIICDQTRQLYSKDMFVLRSALKGQTVTAGDNVRFNVAMGQKGPEASEVVILGHRGTGQVIRPPASIPTPQAAYGQQPAAYGQPPAAYGQYAAYAAQATVPFTTPQQQLMMNTAGAGQTRFNGTVKNWNEEKGWGFVSCQDTMNIYGKDIFLHKKELNGQTPLAGSLVQFGVTIGQDSRPIASSVQLNGNGGYQAARPAVNGYARAAPY